MFEEYIHLSPNDHFIVSGFLISGPRQNERMNHVLVICVALLVVACASAIPHRRSQSDDSATQWSSTQTKHFGLRPQQIEKVYDALTAKDTDNLGDLLALVAERGDEQIAEKRQKDMDYGWSGGRFGKRNIDNNDHLF
jgi:hypothetical protein